MNENKILTHPAFNCLEPERRLAFSRLYVALQGKSPQEASSVIINFMHTMPKGHKITPQEQSTMLSAITEDMSPKEKQRLEMVMKMLL